MAEDNQPGKTIVPGQPDAGSADEAKVSSSKVNELPEVPEFVEPVLALRAQKIDIEDFSPEAIQEKKLEKIMRGARHSNLVTVLDAQVFTKEGKAKGGYISLDPFASLLEVTYPGEKVKSYYIWDKYKLLRPGLQSINCVFRPTTKEEETSSAVTEINKVFNPTPTKKGSKFQLHIAEHVTNIDKFLEEMDWDYVLNEWLSSKINRDPRLLTGFKVASMSMPASDLPREWQYLNPHQMWCTNPGTGKSHIATALGIPLVGRLTDAGLFGGFSNNTQKWRPGSLAGTGTYYIDEFSEATFNDRNKSALISSVLGYLEQGFRSSDYATGGSCEGSVQVIMATNPSEDITPIEAFRRFLNTATGAGAPLYRLGRRIGLVLFGYNYVQISHTANIPYRRIIFLQQVINSIMCMNRSKICSLYLREADWLAKDDIKLSRDLIGKVERLPEGADDIKKFMMGCVGAVHKHKTAAYNVFLIDHLNLIAKAQEGELGKITRRWKSEKDSYIKGIHDILKDSIEQISKPKVPEFTSKEVNALKSIGYTYREMAETTGISKSEIGRIVTK